MDAWWPFHRYSIFQQRARAVEFEPRIGGDVTEVSDTGERSPWGKLIAWEPPSRFVMTWHPGRGAEGAQELEVRFIERDGGKLVQLEQRGWDVVLDQAAAAREGYDQGWNEVLASFETTCAGGAA